MLGASHLKGNVWLHEVRTQIVTPAWVLRPKKGAFKLEPQHSVWKLASQSDIELLDTLVLKSCAKALLEQGQIVEL